MEFLIFLIGIIIVVVKSVNKKNKEAEAAAKRRAAAFEAELDEEAAEERLRQQQARARAAEEAKARSRENMAAQEARADAREAAYRQQKGAPKAAQPLRWRCRCGRDNDVAANFCVACGKPRFDSTAAKSGSMNVSTLEGRAASFEGAAVTGEGMSAAGVYMPGEKRREITAPTVTVPGMAKAARHVVKPLTESAHGHVESSISGVDASCHTPDDPILEEEDAYRISEGTAAPQFSLAFDRNAAVQGLLYAEILGKPRALRK